MEKKYNTFEAKTKLSEILKSVEKTGKPVVICRKGVPIAEIIPFRHKRSRLEPDKSLEGAKFLEEPTEGVSNEDWPEEFR